MWIFFRSSLFVFAVFPESFSLLLYSGRWFASFLWFYYYFILLSIFFYLMSNFFIHHIYEKKNILIRFNINRFIIKYLTRALKSFEFRKNFEIISFYFSLRFFLKFFPDQNFHLEFYRKWFRCSFLFNLKCKKFSSYAQNDLNIQKIILYHNRTRRKFEKKNLFKYRIYWCVIREMSKRTNRNSVRTVYLRAIESEVCLRNTVRFVAN